MRWQKYLNGKTEADYESYKEQRLKVKNLVIKSKQKTWKEFGDKLEQDSRGNQKLFYRVLYYAAEIMCSRFLESNCHIYLNRINMQPTSQGICL